MPLSVATRSAPWRGRGTWRVQPFGISCNAGALFGWRRTKVLQADLVNRRVIIGERLVCFFLVRATLLKNLTLTWGQRSTWTKKRGGAVYFNLPESERVDLELKQVRRGLAVMEAGVERRRTLIEGVMVHDAMLAVHHPACSLMPTAQASVRVGAGSSWARWRPRRRGWRLS